MCTRNTWGYIIIFNKNVFTHSWKNNVSTGDGGYKLIFAINGEIPGPNIMVYEDQIVS